MNTYIYILFFDGIYKIQTNCIIYIYCIYRHIIYIYKSICQTKLFLINGNVGRSGSNMRWHMTWTEGISFASQKRPILFFFFRVSKKSNPFLLFSVSQKRPILFLFFHVSEKTIFFFRVPKKTNSFFFFRLLLNCISKRLFIF